MKVYADMPYFACCTLHSKQQLTITDNPRSYSFTRQEIRQCMKRSSMISKPPFGKRACICILFDKNRFIEFILELFNKINAVPNLHVSYHGNAAFIAKIGTRKSQTDRNDILILI